MSTSRTSSHTRTTADWISRSIGLLMGVAALSSSRAYGQDNYEIDVYPSETVAPKHTMVELHTNYTLQGTTMPINGAYPTQDAIHQTLELTHGFSPTFELGNMNFFSYRTGSEGYQYVGSHLQPRWRVPDNWGWKVGVSLSLEFGYVRPQFAEDTWTLEIRPIVDKRIGNLYAAFNPILDRSFAGLAAGRGFEFSPSFKVSYDVTKKITPGFEYYSAVGPVGGFDALSNQQRQLFVTLNLDVGEDWEFNAGIGEGFTQSTDHLIVKMIVGRRFSF